MKVKIKESRGITLIALIVIIIVLLILSGITISMLTGKNGILGKAAEAKLYGDRSLVLETLRLKISEYMIDGVRTNEEAINRLKEEGYISDDEWLDVNIDKIKSTNNEGTEYYWLQQNHDENFVNSFYLIGYNETDENEFIIGKVFGFDEADILDIFENNPDEFIHQDQSPTNGDRAVGTDGKAVNMDLWNYRADDAKKEVSLGSIMGSDLNPSYSNEDIKGGRIQGSIPQYIKIDGKNDIYTVTSMEYTFGNCTNLTIAPEIPNTVTSMYGTYRECTSLITVSKIPEGVTNMAATFAGCSALTTVPKIPESVINMNSTFSNCTSLEKAPEIPIAVNSMLNTFYQCTSLSGNIKINSGDIGACRSCFQDIVNDIVVQVPKSSNTYTSFNIEYGNSSNITIQQY